MAKTVVMPQMGYDMDAGTLLRWLKQEGDPVERGEAIAEIETDKVNIEIEAFEGGVLRKTLITEGTKVPVGEPIAIIGAADEQIDVPNGAAPPEAPKADTSPTTFPESVEGGEPKTSPPQPSNQTSPTQPQPAPMTTQAQMETQVAAPVPAPAPPSATERQNGTGVVSREPHERIRASPLVRRIAAEHGIDLAGVAGTGPHGRIVKRDIEPYMTGARPQAAPAPAPVAPAAPQPAVPAQPELAPAAAAQPGDLVELSRIRQTIAKRMSQSFQQAPHFYVSSKIDMGKALALREQANADLDDASKMSVNDLIVKAAALALRDFPMLNASYVDGNMQTHAQIDVGMAVALDAGLISPFIPRADEKSLGQIARMSKDLIGRARGGQLKPEEYAGGTFTISNLGMYDVSEFIAIINPPQAAILAVGTARTEARWNAEIEAFEPAQLMTVTMSADHRITDGAEVARYLQRLKALLENPMGLLVG